MEVITIFLFIIGLILSILAIYLIYKFFTKLPNTSFLSDNKIAFWSWVGLSILQVILLIIWGINK
jgi:hypothetical protein